MAKKCKEENCNNNQFGGGYCKYHQYKRKMQGGDLYTLKHNAKKRIPKESKKRKVEHKTYIEQVKEYREECKNNGTYKCFFCGGEEDLTTLDMWLCVHHTEERGKNYLNKETWAWGHNLHHNQFTFETMEFLMKQFWYPDFMIRLKTKSIVAWSKQKYKEQKYFDNCLELSNE